MLVLIFEVETYLDLDCPVSPTVIFFCTGESLIFPSNNRIANNNIILLIITEPTMYFIEIIS